MRAILNSLLSDGECERQTQPQLNTSCDHDGSGVASTKSSLVDREGHSRVKGHAFIAQKLEREHRDQRSASEQHIYQWFRLMSSDQLKLDTRYAGMYTRGRVRQRLMILKEFYWWERYGGRASGRRKRPTNQEFHVDTRRKSRVNTAQVSQKDKDAADLKFLTYVIDDKLDKGESLELYYGGASNSKDPCKEDVHFPLHEFFDAWSHERVQPPKAQLFVEVHGAKTVVVPVGGSTTVDDVKAAVSVSLGIPTDEQRLVIDGKQLEDGTRRVMSTYGILEDSFGRVVHRTLGGMEPGTEGTKPLVRNYTVMDPQRQLLNFVHPPLWSDTHLLVLQAYSLPPVLPPFLPPSLLYSLPPVLPPFPPSSLAVASNRACVALGATVGGGRLTPCSAAHVRVSCRNKFQAAAKEVKDARLLRHKDILRRKGNECYLMGKFKEAIDHYSKAISLGPRHEPSLPPRRGAALRSAVRCGAVQCVNCQRIDLLRQL